MLSLSFAARGVGRRFGADLLWMVLLSGLLLLVAGGCSRSEEFVASRPLPISSPSLSFEVPEASASGAVLAATEWLEVGDRVRVGAAGASGAVANGGTGVLRVGVEAEVGPVWSRGPVDVRDRARVVGTIVHEQGLARGNDVFIGGATQAPVGASTTITFSSVDLGASRGDRRLEPNQTETLVPGAYGFLGLKQNSVVRLTTGRYFFSEVLGDAGGRIELDSLCGAVEIFVGSSLILRSPLVEMSGGPGAGALLAYAGANTAHIETPFRGSIIAPNAELILNSSVHEGRFFARRLRVQAGARVSGSSSIPIPGSYCVGGGGLEPVSGPYCEGEFCCPGADAREHRELRGLCANYEVNGGCVVGSGLSDVVTSSPRVFFGAGGDDFLRDTEVTRVLHGGDGNDSICMKFPGLATGGRGDDRIRVEASFAIVMPGAGVDTLDARAGETVVVTNDDCELSAGDRVTAAPGARVKVLTQVSREVLVARGVQLPSGAEVVATEPNRCASSCSGAPACGPDEVCVDDGPALGMRCASTRSSLSLSTTSLVELFPALSTEVRELLEADLRRALSGEVFTRVSGELRPYAATVIPAARNRLLELRSGPVRAALVDVVGGFQVPASIGALRDVAILGVDNSGYSSWEHNGMQQYERHQASIKAVEWLGAYAARGDSVADAALLDIVRGALNYVREVAALAYLRAADTESRRQLLLQELPESSHHILSLSRRLP